MKVLSNYSLITIILDFGQAGKAIKLAKDIGATGGTIMLGKGTVRSSLLDMLGLNESRKEIILVGIESKLESILHEELRRELELDKPNHGIAFSIPIKKIFGKNFPTFNIESTEEGDNRMVYEAIFTIVNKGMADAVLNSARTAGSTGGTVIHGRGSGTEITEKVFNMEIEPEKDIVLILSSPKDTDNIVESIKKTIGIEKLGNGIIFILDVSRATGLYNHIEN